MKKTLVLSLGSNLGNRYAYIIQAIWSIEDKFKTKTTKANFYETPPWGEENQPKFLNTVVALSTELSAERCLQILQTIERDLLRVKTIKWGPRTIDIDIVLYGNDLLDTPELKIPHPHFHKRSFVLIPLHDIQPQLMHPVLHKTTEQLVKAIHNDTSLFASSPEI